ncbi:MAG: glycosyltransferase [bacterium]|nr:glycosyltransferase [bacterium]
MKLLMITGLGSAKDLASGRRGAFYNTLEEFSKYWTRIDIICPRVKNINSGNPKSEPLNPKQIINSKLQTKILFNNVYLHISPWPLVLHLVFFIKKALEIYKEQRFNLMTVHDFPPFYNGIAARILWQFIKIPYVLEIFHIPGHPRAVNFKESVYKVFFELFIKFDASKAKAVRVMNYQIADFLVNNGVPKEKIVYIPAIYIDLDVFRPMNLPKEYDLIFIGRLEKNKGIDLFIEAVEKLKCKAIIVGDGPIVGSLKSRVKSLKLENNVIFHGWAKDSHEIAELINKSKILVMTSYNEGGPRVVVEALACGVPVLATPVGIVPDLLKNGPDFSSSTESRDRKIEDPRFASHALHEVNRDLGGEIIDWSVEDIALKVKNLLSDSDRHQKYSQDGPEIAKQFEKKAAIKNYAEKIKQLVN